MAARHGVRVWAALATVYVVWGSTFIALAIAVRDLPPFTAMAARHLVAGGLLLAFALPRRDVAGDRIGRPQIVAAFIFGGLLFVYRPRCSRVGSADRSCRCRRAPRRGRSRFGWCCATVLPSGVGFRSRPTPASHLTAYSLLSGEVGEAEWTRDATLALGYLVVAGSLVGFSTYVWLLRSAPTSLVSTYAYVNPIVAVFLAWVLLGEEITVQMIVAGAAVLVSVATILRSSRTTVEPGRGLLKRRALAGAPASEPTA